MSRSMFLRRLFRRIREKDDNKKRAEPSQERIRHVSCNFALSLTHYIIWQICTLNLDERRRELSCLSLLKNKLVLEETLNGNFPEERCVLDILARTYTLNESRRKERRRKKGKTKQEKKKKTRVISLHLGKDCCCCCCGQWPKKLDWR